MGTAAGGGDVVEVVLGLAVDVVEDHPGHIEVVDHELVLHLLVHIAGLLRTSSSSSGLSCGLCRSVNLCMDTVCDINFLDL